jgi:hypothetical protein
MLWSHQQCTTQTMLPQSTLEQPDTASTPQLNHADAPTLTKPTPDPPCNSDFDFNKSHLAPPGKRVVVHIKPAQHHNMAPNGVDGGHVGPSIKHCRCHKCHIFSTFGIQDAALTVNWFSHNIHFPKVTANKCLRQAAANMITLIQDRTAHPIPSLMCGSNVTNARIQVAKTLKRATARPAPAPIIPAPGEGACCPNACTVTNNAPCMALTTRSFLCFVWHWPSNCQASFGRKFTPCHISIGTVLLVKVTLRLFFVHFFRSPHLEERPLAKASGMG